MDKKKLIKQILILISVAGFFVIVDLSIYTVFTRRCISEYSEGMQAKSVELNEYLPFVEESGIVKVDSDLKLSGDLPIIDSAAALYPVSSAFVNATYPEDSVFFDGSDFTDNSALQMNNTRDAYTGIVDGTVDIIICAGPSEQQMAYAAEKGVELVMVPIGLESFVFVVNQNNVVNNLTVEQVKDIYAGEIADWSEVGGENTPIVALQRNEGSGSHTAMLNFMGDTPISMDNATYTGRAIGYSFRFYVEGIVEDGNLKMLSLNGVYPNEENIRNGSYPIVDNFYAIYRADNKNENIPILIEWMLSEEGQRIVEESGYVGVKTEE